MQLAIEKWPLGCEVLNNSPQIEAAADGRPLTSYAANTRSNGKARRVWRLGWRTREFGDQGWRARQFGDQGWRSREFGDQGWRAREFGDQAREIMETSRAMQECRVQKQDNGTPPDFGPGEEVPHLDRGAAHRRATSLTGISGMAAVDGASIGSGT